MGQDTEIPLTLERVAIDSGISSKEDALRRVGGLLSEATGALTAEQVFEALVERERLRSTGLGRGVALPHARLDTSGVAVGALLSLPGGVDFDAPDGKPVSLIFGLLMPADAGSEHLRLLAQLASAFREPQFGEALRTADSPGALFETFRLQTHG